MASTSPAAAPATPPRRPGARAALAYAALIITGLGLYAASSGRTSAPPAFLGTAPAPACRGGAAAGPPPAGPLPLLALGARVAPSSWNQHRQHHPLFLIDGSQNRQLTWAPAPRDPAPRVTLTLPRAARLDTLDLHLARSLRDVSFDAQCLDHLGSPTGPITPLPRRSGLVRTARLNCPSAHGLRVNIHPTPDHPRPQLTELTLHGCLHDPE